MTPGLMVKAGDKCVIIKNRYSTFCFGTRFGYLGIVPLCVLEWRSIIGHWCLSQLRHCCTRMCFLEFSSSSFLPPISSMARVVQMTKDPNWEGCAWPPPGATASLPLLWWRQNLMQKKSQSPTNHLVEPWRLYVWGVSVSRIHIIHIHKILKKYGEC